MQDLIRIIHDYTFQIVAFGAVLLGLLSGILGCFTVLRKQSLIGDGMAHSSLPGVALAFLVYPTKDLTLLLAGAFVTALLASVLINGAVRYTITKFDTALALVMSSMFGFGLMLISSIQKMRNARQAGIKNVIFGQAASMLRSDLTRFIILGCILFILVILLWKEIKIFIFDPSYAQVQGFSPRIIQSVLSFLLVMGIMLGLQTVGAILIVALFIAPAVAARQWTDRFLSMVVIASVIGAVSGFLGTLLSSMIPNLATGPTIVVWASGFAILSLIFGRTRGIVPQAIRRAKGKDGSGLDLSFANEKMEKELDQ